MADREGLEPSHPFKDWLVSNQLPIALYSAYLSVFKISTPGRTRTFNLQIRRLAL